MPNLIEQQSRQTITPSLNYWTHLRSPRTEALCFIFSNSSRSSFENKFEWREQWHHSLVLNESLTDLKKTWGVTKEFAKRVYAVKIAFFLALLTLHEARKVYLGWCTVCLAIDTRVDQLSEKKRNKYVISKFQAGSNLKFHADFDS